MPFCCHTPHFSLLISRRGRDQTKLVRHSCGTVFPARIVTLRPGGSNRVVRVPGVSQWEFVKVAWQHETPNNPRPSPSYKFLTSTPYMLLDQLSRHTSWDEAEDGKGVHFVTGREELRGGRRYKPITSRLTPALRGGTYLVVHGKLRLGDMQCT